MKTESFQFTSSDGLDVFVHKWLPDNGDLPKGVLQLAHGATEHAKRYEHFAKFLVENGFAVYANDHRGHGKTADSLEDLSYFSDQDNGWDLAVEDMHRLSDHINADYPELPVFLMGHSMGSFLTREYILRYGKELNGVVLSGTGGGLVLLVKMMKFMSLLMMGIKGRKHHSPFLTELLYGGLKKKIKNRQTDFDFLTRDSAEVQKYIDDPYCGYTVTPEYAYQLAYGISRLYKKKSFNSVPSDLPMMIFSGEKDPVGGENGKDVEVVYRKYLKGGLEDVSLKIYPEARHEMINETNRREVFNDILDWMNERIAA